MNCRVCDIPLTQDNSYPSMEKSYNYICKECNNIKAKEYARLRRRKLGMKMLIKYPFHKLRTDNNRKYQRLLYYGNEEKMRRLAREYYHRWGEFRRKASRIKAFHRNHKLPIPHLKRESWKDGRKPNVLRLSNGRFATLTYKPSIKFRKMRG